MFANQELVSLSEFSKNQVLKPFIGSQIVTLY